MTTVEYNADDEIRYPDEVHVKQFATPVYLDSAGHIKLEPPGKEVYRIRCYPIPGEIYVHGAKTRWKYEPIDFDDNIITP